MRTGGTGYVPLEYCTPKKNAPTHLHFSRVGRNLGTLSEEKLCQDRHFHKIKLFTGGSGIVVFVLMLQRGRVSDTKLTPGNHNNLHSQSISFFFSKYYCNAVNTVR